MPIKPLPISFAYDQQRFLQYSPSSCSNHYAVDAPTGKKGKALYPVMGRQHLLDNSGNPFVYPVVPQKIFKSINYVYVVAGNTIWQINDNFNQVVISTNVFNWNGEDLNFAFLPVVQGASTTPSAQTQAVFCMFCTGNNIYVLDETTGVFSIVTDILAPPFPLYVAAFGNRFVVSTRNSTQFQLTQINLGGTYNASNVFTISGAAVFAQESGIIQQMAVLHQQLYMFTDYTTGVWSNTPSVFVGSTNITTTFPWKKNTSYDFDYGIADPHSLDVDFGMLVWLAQNRNGLVTFMSSNGQSPQPISTQAINVLIQQIADAAQTESLLEVGTNGFLYQYEDTIFYRAVVGDYIDYDTTDNASFAKCVEYNFNTQTWHLCIELNGQRNIIQDHQFFNNKHVTIAQGQTSLYDMSGKFYSNEMQDDPIANPLSWTVYPMRYENVSNIISEDDYSEFITDWIQIDFVWGETGNNLTDLAFNPNIELFWSDDGGITFNSADALEFSQLGVYSWRMRFYQAGASRNRVYKLVCISIYPIVILGGIQSVRKSSGGAL